MSERLETNSTDYKTNCLVCGSTLVYSAESDKSECYYCKKIYDSNVKCAEGHFICDRCHEAPATELIKQFCTSSQSEDPVEMALTLMRNPAVKMHGPEHHFLVPAVLLSVYYNLKKDNAKKAAKIEEAEKRAKNVLGGFCGFYGDCGAAVGTGVFISLITEATPLSEYEWKLSNLITARSLLSIANKGGPRCCKRNTFLAIIEAAKFLRKNFGVDLTIKKVKCEFNLLNKECRKDSCPFYERKRQGFWLLPRAILSLPNRILKYRMGQSRADLRMLHPR